MEKVYEANQDTPEAAKYLSTLTERAKMITVNVFLITHKNK